jgi:sensor domain CHASE-containing protein
MNRRQLINAAKALLVILSLLFATLLVAVVFTSWLVNL